MSTLSHEDERVRSIAAALADAAHAGGLSTVRYQGHDAELESLAAELTRLREENERLRAVVEPAQRLLDQEMVEAHCVDREDLHTTERAGACAEGSVALFDALAALDSGGES